MVSCGTYIEAAKEERVELMDGIKIFHDGAWVSIIPDEDRPFFHVNAEAPVDCTARELTRRDTGLIRSWQDCCPNAGLKRCENFRLGM